MPRGRQYLTFWGRCDKLLNTQYGRIQVAPGVWANLDITELEWCLWEAIRQGHQGKRVHIEFRKLDDRECCLSMGG